MHKINVLTLGSKNFNTSLEELKDFFNFNLNFNLDNGLYENKKYDVLLVHEDYLEEETIKKNLLESNSIKILITKKNQSIPKLFNYKISLPTTVKELNVIVENSIAKRNFSKNSSISIKGYTLDKNEKKLIKDDLFILLTEKEIQLLELFLKRNKSINKEYILKEVWNYAEDADTHTVETHIYRLRKKIKDKFSDDHFIDNNKAGYTL